MIQRKTHSLANVRLPTRSAFERLLLGVRANMAQEVLASSKLAVTVGATLHGHIETGYRNNCLYQRDIKRMSN